MRKDVAAQCLHSGVSCSDLRLSDLADAPGAKPDTFLQYSMSRTCFTPPDSD